MLICKDSLSKTDMLCHIEHSRDVFYLSLNCAQDDKIHPGAIADKHN